MGKCGSNESTYILATDLSHKQQYDETSVACVCAKRTHNVTQS